VAPARPAEPLVRARPPAAAPATVKVGGRAVYKPGDEDQFDIPTFLRKNGGREGL
jgi:hypothetical protein